jgi:Uncharacterized protein conserved in bacteria
MIGVCRLPAWIAATLVPFALSVAMAQAQTSYPDHPVKIIVPIAAGGSYDLVGRLLADALSKRTGQAFFVENKPGAGTVVGTQAAAQSEPDGHTLLIGGLSNMAFNSALYSKLAYDPQRDFVPVAVVYKFGYVMVGRKDMPQTGLADIVAAAKANPGSITVATAGVGTGQHLVAAAFMKAAGVKLQEVPYKGSPPASPICWRAVSICSSIRSRRACRTCSRDRLKASPCCRRGAARLRLTCRLCRRQAYPVSISIPGLESSRPPKPRRRPSQGCAGISALRCPISGNASRRVAAKCGICRTTGSMPLSCPNTTTGQN